jgi:hypothetical protein
MQRGARDKGTKGLGEEGRLVRKLHGKLTRPVQIKRTPVPLFLFSPFPLCIEILQNIYI